MPKNRIIPAIAVALIIPLWAWAQGTPPEAVPTTAAAATKEASPPPEPPTEAERAVDEAAKKVSALETVSADVVEKVEMLGEKFEIQGRYLKAPDRRVYLRLVVSGLPDSSGMMLLVCDGQTLWDHRQVFETNIYTRFTKVDEIVAKLKSPDLDDATRDQLTAQLGMAGPDILLLGLRKAVKFDQKESDTLDGRPVWVLRGNWRDRTGLIGPNQQPLPALAPLPSYIPSLVSVYVGKEDGWPYKVLLVGQAPSLLKEDTRPIGPDGRRIGPRSLIQKPLLTRIELSYQNVKLNTAIAATEFAIPQAPPNATVEDNTQVILNELEKAVQVRAAERKAAEAGKDDNALLDQSIPVPKAAPAPLPPSGPGSPSPSPK
jgi:outer membrane lipoprotein-sorting protein